MANPRQQILDRILKPDPDQPENINTLLEPVLNDILGAINENDLPAIRDALQQIDLARFRDLRDADNGLAESFDAIENNGEIDAEFKGTVDSLKKGLQRLQLNILLSICKVADDQGPQMKNLIVAIQGKINALNNLYINKPESEPIKNALQNNANLQVPVLAGGDNDEYYKQKYLKYKAKYVNLKN